MSSAAVRVGTVVLFIDVVQYLVLINCDQHWELFSQEWKANCFLFYFLFYQFTVSSLTGRSHCVPRCTKTTSQGFSSSPGSHKEEKKRIIHMYGIRPLCTTLCWPPALQETHVHTDTHARQTAYYLYEVLHTSDHQHRVSVFSNPHSVWKDCSVQQRDYNVGLMGVLIWVIIRVFAYKKKWGKMFTFFVYIFLYIYFFHLIQMYSLLSV